MGGSIYFWFCLGGIPHWVCARENEQVHFLILKREQRKSISQFGPLCLNNVVMKIVSEVITNRWKPLVGDLVGKEQASFTLGRHTNNNILIVTRTTMLVEEEKEHQRSNDRENQSRGDILKDWLGILWNSSVGNPTRTWTLISLEYGIPLTFHMENFGIPHTKDLGLLLGVPLFLKWMKSQHFQCLVYHIQRKLGR